ncbi:PHD-finger domain-containing protein [Babesia ovis]|uniref:PHD-finger domain-containing protein n=1 Tax=Babesia ovis TaxID=5869 RepID=A0A9W5WTC6_BABOV|nr:PHD-finger domain-containing protein [Babesia ovis]
MDQDLAPTRETSQEDDRFWIETERQYFSNPNPSLISCLRNHAWHCRYIARQSRQLLKQREEASRDHSSASREVKRAKVSQNGTSTSSKANAVVDRKESETPEECGIQSVYFRIKNKGSTSGTQISLGNNPHLPIVNSVSGDLSTYLDERNGFYLPRHNMPGFDDDIYYNPVVNAKHDSKLRLPVIFPSQAPDGIRLLLYCPNETGRPKNVQRRPGNKSNVLDDVLSPEQLPEILYGPAPVWSKTVQPAFKDGKDICPPYDKCTTLLKQLRGTIADPVWESHNDIVPQKRSITSFLLKSLGFTDVAPPCTVDYSPKLFTFVEAGQTPVCRRCLGMSKVACPMCINRDKSATVPGVCFSNPATFNHKYEFVFNKLDIYKARTIMGTQEFVQPSDIQEDEPCPLKRSRDDDITAVLKEYVDTLEEIDVTFSTLLDRVQKERKPNFDYWSQVESQMIKSYIEQYNNKVMDNRYNYNTQRQSYDVLRIRLSCSKSSNLPAQWTDHALCSICGSDEEWDDDPILFCDCCYIPMHYCCLGYKPGTMSETVRQNVRRHKLLHTKEDDEPNIDEDEWMCPSCIFLLDQLAFIDENMALKAIRIAAGPRNKQMVDILRDNPNGDNFQPLEISKLPYIVGFEYDNPVERIDLCTLYRRTPVVHVPTGSQASSDKEEKGDKDDKAQSNKVDTIRRRKLTFPYLVECGNIPTTVAITLPGEDIQSPFDVDLEGFEMDVLGRTITQFWSFKGMTKAQLEIASDIFDEHLVEHMTNGNLDGMLKLFMFLPKEEENTHHLIQQDRIMQRQKSLPQKRGRRSVGLTTERPAHVVAAINAEVVRGPETEVVRDDMYSLNCKNPLKKLVICVRMARNFFVNLKIPVCVFCGFDAYYPGGGPMKRTSNPGTWAHVRCAIAVDCTITPKHVDYNTFVPKVKALKCLVCHHMSTAIVQCSHGTCCKAFHVSCAAASSCCLFTWDQNGKPDILCPQHASGLAPTVLLRKLQAKVQYKNYKKLSTHETNLDSVNPKDDVFLTHLLEPNYRSIASVIEQLFDLEPRAGFPIPLYGDEVVIRPSLVDVDKPGEASDTPSATESKSKHGKKNESRLPLRDKSGKFKVAEKNKVAVNNVGLEDKVDSRVVVEKQHSSETINKDEQNLSKEEPVDETPTRTLRPRRSTPAKPAPVKNTRSAEKRAKSLNGTETSAKNTKGDSTDDSVKTAKSDSSTETSAKNTKEDTTTDDSVKNTKSDTTKPLLIQTRLDFKAKHKEEPSGLQKASKICNITQLEKENCFWCSMGNDDTDDQTHYKLFYDDRCPTAEHVGSLLFPDFSAAKKSGGELFGNKKEEPNIKIEGVPALVWSDICAGSRVVDEKMLSYISDDFIGGKRLISEVAAKGVRSSFLGLTRLLNILYYKSKNGAEMFHIFDDLLKHMKTMQSLDEARRNCEMGTNQVEELYTPLTPMSPNYTGLPRGMHPAVDYRKESRLRVREILSTLNQSWIMRLGPDLLPSSILRVVGSKTGQEDLDDVDVSRQYVVCSGCLEFKVIEQQVEEDSSTMRKRVNYAQHYKTCRCCNARACSDCLSHMKAARLRLKVNPGGSSQVHGTATDPYMSAATLLSQPIYHGLNPPTPRNMQPMMDDDRITSVRSAMISLPLMARSPLIDRPGTHPGHLMGVTTPMNGGGPVGAMMAPNMARASPNTPSPVHRLMPRPQMGSPLPMRNPTMPDVPAMPPSKSVMMPMCSTMPLSVPTMCSPLYNGAKTVHGIYERDIPGNICGGPFSKMGPMIKSPPVKNGPYLTNPVGVGYCKDGPPPMSGGFTCSNNPNVLGLPVPLEPSSNVIGGGISGIGNAMVSAVGNGMGVGNNMVTTMNDESNETFICCRCEDMEHDVNMPLLCCVLCSRFDGLLVPVSREQLSFYLTWTSEYCGYSYVHLVCLDWLTYSKVISASLRKFPKSMFDFPCHYCGVASGATLTCTNNYCSVRFHASCGAWLGCKVDMGKKPEGVTTASRRVYCLRHTFLNITRTSQVERKFMIAPPHLYQLLVSTRHHLSCFYGGVYISKYCVPNKMRNENVSRPTLNRPTGSGLAAVKRPKLPLKNGGTFTMSSINNAVNMLGAVNYMSLGLVLSKSTFGQPVNEYSMISDDIARDRLIQALNWTAYNAMNLVPGRKDKKEIRTIIQMIKAGQLKPIHGSKRGRKPKSLDGSNFDNRQKMPMEDILTYCHSGQLDSGEFFCPVCFSIYFERSPGLPGDDLHWIGCDGCERWFHFVCAGVWADSQVDANSPSWFCLACTRQRVHQGIK